jgi:transcriptional regulator with GAF, ATPase, and Fis domain
VDEPADLTRLKRERELYLTLLDLGLQDNLEPFLEQALRWVAEASGAHQGYLELRSLSEESGGPSTWSTAFGLSSAELSSIRSTISTGIIATVLESGETVVTRSASSDHRFESRESVQTAQIQAVLCAPIGANPGLGVIYLQRRIEPGPFSEADRVNIETFARHLAPFADRLIMKRVAIERSDPTRAYREGLRVAGIVGRSPALARVLREVSLVAPLEVDVLLTGESGTGKSQVARAIHDNSPRADKPFVELNCAALPESLVESELFGALPGAHSTAARRIEGKVGAAQGGTLLLDEIGDLPSAAQAKLLQLLQSRVYFPLGATKPVTANVRIIAGTNLDLEAAIREGRFRSDLFYRLAVLPIRMPALRERREDIPALAAYFCEQTCRRHRLAVLTLSSQACAALATAEWPGNVRQLAHAVEAAAIRANAAGVLQIEKEHVFLTAGNGLLTPNLCVDGTPASPVDLGAAAGADLTFQEATRRFQAQLLQNVLEETHWSVPEAANRLELARSYVYALIRGFGLRRPFGR